MLFEDDYLIAINKPSGLPSQPTMDAARANLFDSAKALLSADIGGGEAYLGMHHRLDRDTSGVIVFTKSRVANAAMAHAFKEHGIQKTYLALSLRPAKKPPDRWHVENNLGVVSRKGGRARYGAVRSGGDRARTDFSLLEASDRALLIEARPLTGRTHQIRVHLAGCGLPILGDDLYGAADGAGVDVPRLMLHAHLLRLDHPVTGVLLEICAPLPEDFSGVKKKIIGG
ncbi:MAG: hypothetical protein A2583_02910 [Bdellovibrionales bacterium RIFOXYD1_FULL_53_11]|nr:MAG: hypothetical protein A2583_02910 [Bdellovibrionales bacterium RIFOXYD1_FULL_53_11]